jgi:glycosyltransferase involved in cell wall biosynthesis
VIRAAVIIPAHNEADVIALTLQRLTRPGDTSIAEILVVCNGCTDDTAAVAGRFEPSVRVLHCPVASKTEAINLGLSECQCDHVVIMDADVALTPTDVAEIGRALLAPGVMSVAPSVRTVFADRTSWMVRTYYRFWMSLPYVKEGMMAAGVYALNRAGRDRIGVLPRIIADDGFVRMHFNETERREVASAVSEVAAPVGLDDLIKIKTRSRLGWYELRAKFPQLFVGEVGRRNYAAAFASCLTSPANWIAIWPYLLVNVLSRHRAKRQAKKLSSYVWERDTGSRRAMRAGELQRPESSR